MKKNIIALAVASAIAAPVAMADAPTVYGQLNMSIDSVTDKGISIGSNASRVGVKGSEDLGNGLKAVYKMEWEADITGGAGPATGATTLKDRNAYLGLAGSFGTVLLGRHDTPMKMAQPTDTFNDGFGDNTPMAAGLGYAGAAGEVRAANVIAFVSPDINGLKIVTAGVVNAAKANDQSLVNASSTALMYGSTKKGLFLSGAYNSYSSNTTAAPAGSAFSEMRLAAQYKMAGLMGNVMYQTFDSSSSVDQASEGANFQVNVSYDMGALTPKIKYSSVDYKKKSLKDGSAYGLGVDYAMGKKTTSYVEYVDLDKNLAGKGTPTKSMSYISVGLLTKF